MRSYAPNTYYHVLTRGNNKENIFFYKRDYLRHLKLLEKYSNKFSIQILAYALMPNHVHLLLTQTGETPLSKFMQSLNTAYAVYFNNRHRHFGHLFQNRFKYIIIERDEYLVHLSRYIHLNPSSSNLVAKPEEYPWTTYRHYLGVDNVNFVDKKTILSYFSSKDRVGDYKEFVTSRIDYQKQISIQKLFLDL